LRRRIVDLRVAAAVGFGRVETFIERDRLIGVGRYGRIDHLVVACVLVRLVSGLLVGQGGSKRLVGLYGGLGRALGLSNDWAVRIVRHVGNYGEAFARNLGTQSAFAIPRGLNELWYKGGIEYAPPIR
jgi:hypothetical protein